MSFTQEELIDHTLAELSALQKKDKLSLKPPEVRFKNHRTVFSNFTQVCNSFNRGSPDGIQHLKSYIEKESGFKSSIDGESKLLIVGSVKPPVVESILKKYFEEFVTCTTCKSPVTSIERDNRLHYICCERCSEHNCVKNY